MKPLVVVLLVAAANGFVQVQATQTRTLSRAINVDRKVAELLDSGRFDKNSEKHDLRVNFAYESSPWYDNLMNSFTGVFNIEKPKDEVLPLEIDTRQISQLLQRNYKQNNKTTSEVEAANDYHLINVTNSNSAEKINDKLREKNSSEGFPAGFSNCQLQATSADNNESNNITTIDKIKGIDLPFNMRQNLNLSKHQDRISLVRHQRGANCFKTEFDSIISRKLSQNELSRPIVTSTGRFDNPFSTWNQPSLIDGFKFMVFEKDQSSVPKNVDDIAVELPMLKPNFTVDQKDKDDFKVTWIGHSTLVIQIDGLNIMTDPIFSSRASPMQFFGPKRIREAACRVNELPKIDAILISHNHYDHLDADSVRQINDRFGEECRWIIPLGLGDFMRSMSVVNFVELDWWQKDCIPLNSDNTETNEDDTNVTTTISSPTTNLDKQATSLEKKELNIYLTPTQHWSRRGVNDVNKSLWGSFTLVSSQNSTFFFGGDTAYCPAFKEISSVFGPMTGAAIPIGAYRPRWFLKSSHADPHEAVQIHRDLESRKSIAIHHSTFILSNEHYLEPAKLLKEIMSDLQKSESVTSPFIALKHGETAGFCKGC